MKKLLSIFALLFVLTSFGQTQTFLKPVAFKSVPLGTATDSILSIGSDGAMRYVLKSTMRTVTPLTSKDEGNGAGIIRTGREPLNYGNIGFEGLDLSLSNFPSSTLGATGSYSFATGFQTTASGTGSRADGGFTIASSVYSHAEGFYSVASGSSSRASGSIVYAPSHAETSIGLNGDIYTPLNTSGYNALDRLFGVYNGVTQGSPSTAFLVLKDGTITAPSLTNAKITSAGLKAIPTVEYLNTVITSGATPDATPTVKGKAKLFTTLGTSTDGSIDQNTANTNFNLKENTSNKVTTITGNEASTTLFPVVKANLDFLKLGLVGLLPAKSTSLVDADLLLAGDSADSFKTKTRTFGQLKSTLSSTFFLDATSSIQTQINSKQATLVSGTNIKTINGNSLLGSGDLVISGGGGSTGTVNYIPKFNTTTTQANSRLFDNGTFFGIDTVTPTKDLSFGNQSNREIGVEAGSTNGTGKNLALSSGNSTSFVQTSNGPFNAISGYPSIITYGIFIDKNNSDIYLPSNGDIYKVAGGIGNPVSLGQTGKDWFDITKLPNGDIYASASNVGLYKQTGGVGNFVLVNSTFLQAYAVESAPNGDVYVGNGSKLYKQSAGTSTFTELTSLTTASIVRAISITPNGVIYIGLYGGSGGFYSSTDNGTTFNFISTGNSSFTGLKAYDNGVIYGATFSFQVLKSINYGVTFSSIDSSNARGIDTDINENVYISVGTEILKSTTTTVNTPNLSAGSLNLKSGLAKGTGSSRISFYTGQKTASGTTTQVETIRGNITENGNWLLTSNPSYVDDQTNRLQVDGDAKVSQVLRANTLIVTGTLEAGNIDIDGTLASNSDIKLSTQKAIKTYVDTKAILQSTPTDPATTTSTAGVMMGLNQIITPLRSGKLMIIISGDVDNTVGSSGSQFQIRYGTGTAPTNGVGLTGTALGALRKVTNGNATGVGVSYATPMFAYSLNGIATGLTVGTPYWIDISLASITSGTSRTRDISVSIVEQ